MCLVLRRAARHAARTRRASCKLAGLIFERALRVMPAEEILCRKRNASVPTEQFPADIESSAVTRTSVFAILFSSARIADWAALDSRFCFFAVSFAAITRARIAAVEAFRYPFFFGQTLLGSSLHRPILQKTDIVEITRSLVSWITTPTVQLHLMCLEISSRSWRKPLVMWIRKQQFPMPPYHAGRLS